MIEAAYFDGRTSRLRPVRLRADANGLELTGPDLHLRQPASAIRVSEPIGGAPRTLTFADGGYCEVEQGRALDALLQALGHRDHAVARWQQSWRLALGGIAFMLVVLFAAYRWGLPWLSARIAPRVPPVVTIAMSDQVLKAFDGRLLGESQLSADRQARIETEFRALAAKDPALAGARLLFRHSPRIGPNAFALPDGRIVVLDELVDLADSDDQILGVAAHELGHVKYRHGLRQVMQSSVVAAVAAAWFGDISSLLSGLSAVLLESKYSRNFELEADDFAATMMKADGKSPAALALLLEKMERVHAEKSGRATSGSDWLSSHPDTLARIARLRTLR